MWILRACGRRARQHAHPGSSARGPRPAPALDGDGQSTWDDAGQIGTLTEPRRESTGRTRDVHDRRSCADVGDPVGDELVVVERVADPHRARAAVRVDQAGDDVATHVQRRCGRQRLDADPVPAHPEIAHRLIGKGRPPDVPYVHTTGSSGSRPGSGSCVLTRTPVQARSVPTATWAVPAITASTAAFRSPRPRAGRARPAAVDGRAAGARRPVGEVDSVRPAVEQVHARSASRRCSPCESRGREIPIRRAANPNWRSSAMVTKNRAHRSRSTAPLPTSVDTWNAQISRRWSIRHRRSLPG